MFDAGFKWIRIGPYENSSDRTGWDWKERGVYFSSQELEDHLDSGGQRCQSSNTAAVWRSHVHSRSRQDARRDHFRAGFVS